MQGSARAGATAQHKASHGQLQLSRLCQPKPSLSQQPLRLVLEGSDTPRPALTPPAKPTEQVYEASTSASSNPEPQPPPGPQNHTLGQCLMGARSSWW